MPTLNDLLGQGANIDLGALAAHAGLNGDQVQQGIDAILARLRGGESGDAATAGAAAETGLSFESLQALLPALQAQLGEGGLDGIMAQFTGEGGLLSSLDRDGDGNTMDDIADIAQNIFNRS
jgi:hypothetical protein